MEPFTKHTGIAALMNRRNVDTDQIIPKQFLKKVERTGFGVHLFQDWRYQPDGSENPEFELNQPAFRGASILVAGDNFGCGSSREHAPWAIRDYGFRVVISTSFADIFFSNCFKNGILPMRVLETELQSLMEEIMANERVEFSVDLEAQTLTTPGGQSIRFEVEPFRKESLLQGLDDIAWTQKHQDEILAFEKHQRQDQPWLWE